ncbi:sensor histidine kinase KdpD [Okeania sp. SIO2B9]|uniref:sensor histidine kinase n=1 Tax=Okeania sp. SIO2B9 TaxID=2607782 RepID=UPI00257C8BB5|nr:HAMP domain-containing sensor histidine kinase [Okeania sp. SIO2B9]
MRNPLAAARTNLELALSNPDATVEELRHSADVAHRSTERMGAMVDNLLQQARVGVPEVTRSEVDLAAIAADVAEEFRAAARTRNLVVALEAPNPVLLKADGPALRRAVANLVSNAVRLAPEGSTVQVRSSVEDGQAIVAVTDEGPGLTEPEQSRVFERFWRGDDSGTGTGLGLSIVRQIAERHGGTALVASRPDTGSTFTIKLPMMARQASSAEPIAPPAKDPDRPPVPPTTIVGR